MSRGPSRWLVPATATLTATLTAILCGGCGAATPRARTADDLLARHPARAVTVESRNQPGLGRILTDGAGHTLYMFPPDARAHVTCTGPCAGTWPALAVRPGVRPTAAGGVRQSLLGEVHDPNTGARVVTYAGNPLYRYAGDVTSSTANGQALFIDGGPWYVLTPAGEPLTQDLPPRAGGHR